MESSHRIERANDLIRRIADKQRRQAEYRRKAIVARLERSSLEVELRSILTSASGGERQTIDAALERQRRRFRLPQQKHLWKDLLTAPTTDS